jgi:hypothetical protein
MALSLMVAAVALIIDPPKVESVQANSPVCAWNDNGEAVVTMPTPGVPAIVTLRPYEDGSVSVYPRVSASVYERSR